MMMMMMMMMIATESSRNTGFCVSPVWCVIYGYKYLARSSSHNALHDLMEIWGGMLKVMAESESERAESALLLQKTAPRGKGRKGNPNLLKLLRTRTAENLGIFKNFICQHPSLH